jgi:ribonuclease HII
MNILEASKRALCSAVRKLPVAPDFLFVDALTLDLEVPQRALIGGDTRCASIAAASIVAKVARDRVLKDWHRVYPGFRFDSNKGYAAPDHYRGLDDTGPTALHRFSFAPVGQRTLFASV